jgi:preprotein translocase subunit SecD
VAAPSGQLKASRYFLVLAGILVLLYGLVFLTGDKKPHPKLGLDLKGGTTLTLTATNQANGKPPTKENLDQSRQIIADRVDAQGVSEAEVVTDGNKHIVVNVAQGIGQDELKKLVAPSQLMFRKVLSTGTDHPYVAPSASPSVSGSASATAPATTAPATTAPATTAPATTAPASASASGSASGSASPSVSLNASEKAAAVIQAERLDSAKKKLGEQYDLAVGVIQQIQGGQSQITAQQLDQHYAEFSKFAELTPDEVGALDPLIQFYVPTVTCEKLNAREPGAVGDKAQGVVACGTNDAAHTKYLLDVAKVAGTDVKGADAGYDTQNGGWNVSVKFTGAGQSRWTALTQALADEGKSSGQTSSLAIVLDNEVVSAPTVSETIAGDARISGTGITESTSKVLANQLKFGALPVSFKIESVDSVSATLGLQQLKYGLLAGAIGLLLVVVYCLIYYRALGLVVIASLGVSAALVFATLVLLGRLMGFTLSLAGIAGFIVAIGITADSFVVFFERLKDEVKTGRSVRSSVPRAWQRARRTILSADAVSFLAAAILFWLAAGQVKGFAFTLGVSTIIDLVVVFFFTHPLVAMLAKSSAFTSPKVSGLGNLRTDRAAESATASAARLRTTRTKES